LAAKAKPTFTKTSKLDLGLVGGNYKAGSYRACFILLQTDGINLIMKTTLLKELDIPKAIRELKYARQLHLGELSYRIKEQKDAIQEKDFVIKTLVTKKPAPSDIKRTIKILKKWQRNHLFWIDLVRQNKRWARKGGSLSWHKRWIKVYQDVLDYLDLEIKSRS